jgi:hypothetical protein
MAKHSKRHHISDAIQDEAMKIARGTQRPGQTKQQTKLIAQGIKKGIELYKKRESAKAREQDKKLKKANHPSESPDEPITKVREKVVYKQHWLPWVLLIISWLVMAGYIYVG